MPARKKPDIVFARATTLVFTPQRCNVVVGQAWHAAHPIVAAHPDLFSDEPPEILPRGWEPPSTTEPKVEQATKAPGEKRATRRAD